LGSEEQNSENDSEGTALRGDYSGLLQRERGEEKRRGKERKGKEGGKEEEERKERRREEKRGMEGKRKRRERREGEWHLLSSQKNTSNM
jgi:hypothetical protein